MASFCGPESRHWANAIRQVFESHLRVCCGQAAVWGEVDLRFHPNSGSPGFFVLGYKVPDCREEFCGDLDNRLRWVLKGSLILGYGFLLGLLLIICDHLARSLLIQPGGNLFFLMVFLSDGAAVDMQSKVFPSARMRLSRTHRRGRERIVEKGKPDPAVAAQQKREAICPPFFVPICDRFTGVVNAR
jgi:hypothetical protein